MCTRTASPAKSCTARRSGEPSPPKPLRFVLTRAHVMLLAGGSVLAAVLIVLLGVGVGARLAQPHPSALSRTVTSQATPPPGVFLR